MSIDAELDAVFAAKPLDEWAEAFGAQPELFWSPINSMEDVVADEQFHAGGGVVYVPAQDGKRLRPGMRVQLQLPVG